jgi:flagellar protein FlaG
MDVNLITSRIAVAQATPAQPVRPTSRPAPQAEQKPETPPERTAPAEGPDLKFTLRSADAEAKFAVHEATNSVMVTIVDRTTGEVIREIPSRERLDLIAALQGKGNLLDTSQ